MLTGICRSPLLKIEKVSLTAWPDEDLTFKFAYLLQLNMFVTALETAHKMENI